MNNAITTILSEVVVHVVSTFASPINLQQNFQGGFAKEKVGVCKAPSFFLCLNLRTENIDPKRCRKGSWKKTIEGQILYRNRLAIVLDLVPQVDVLSSCKILSVIFSSSDLKDFLVLFFPDSLFQAPGIFHALFGGCCGGFWSQLHHHQTPSSASA